MNLRVVRDQNKADTRLQRVFPRGSCELCGTEFTISFDYQRMGLCEECARRAGAAYLKAHAGEYHRVLDPEGFEREQAERRRLRALRPPKKAISDTIRPKVFKRDGYRCKRCGSQQDLEPDHIVAEARGGPTTLENLQTLCRPCNLRKGARDA